MVSRSHHPRVAGRNAPGVDIFSFYGRHHSKHNGFIPVVCFQGEVECVGVAWSSVLAWAVFTKFEPCVHPDERSTELAESSVRAQSP